MNRHVMAAFAGLALIPGVAAAAGQNGPIPVPPVRPNAPAQRPPSAPLPPHPGAVYLHIKPVLPSPETVKALFPAKAVADEVEGSGVVDCAVKTDGSLWKCEVVSENPGGYGFGAASVAVFSKYVHIDPAQVAGGIKPDMRLRHIWRWQFPDA